MEKDQIIQVRVTKDELDLIKKAASDKGFSISDYVRYKVFDGAKDEVAELYDELIAIVDTLPSNTEFCINTVLWQKFQKASYSTRISLGKYFMKMVKSKTIKVEKLDKTKGNAQVYKKI